MPEATVVVTEHGLITKESPEWIRINERVKSVEDEQHKASNKLERTERAIIGGFDDSGIVWRAGIRENVEKVDRKVDSLASTTQQGMDEMEGRINIKIDKVDERAASMSAVVKWATCVLTSILIALGVEGLNNAFGWWGTAHVVLHP